VVMLDLLLWLRRCFFPVMRRVGPGVCDLLCRLSASVTRISGIVIIGIVLAVVAVVVSSVMSRRLQGASTVLQRVLSSVPCIWCTIRAAIQPKLLRPEVAAPGTVMCASRTACSHVYYGRCVATSLRVSAVFVLAKTVQCQFLDEMAVESLR